MLETLAVSVFQNAKVSGFRQRPAFDEALSMKAQKT